MTSANLLIVIIVGTVVGALTGLALNGVFEGLYLAVAAGFLGTIIAGIVVCRWTTRFSSPNTLLGLT
jgi:uncharacterized membrane protein YeaQ/YmgE (transglycosylase-associated protein family)